MRQFKRYLRVNLSAGGLVKTYTDKFNIKFNVKRTLKGNSADTANVEIYNPDPQLYLNLFNTKDVKIEIDAGYDEVHGIIYSGKIQDVNNDFIGADNVLRITSGDGLEALTAEKMKESFGLNIDKKTVVKKIAQFMEETGGLIQDAITKKNLDKITGKLSLGFNCRDYAGNSLDEVLEDTEYDYLIHNGVLRLYNEPFTRNVTVLRGDTGLLGTPQKKIVTQKSGAKTAQISLKAQIQPTLEPNQRIDIDSRTVKGKATIIDSTFSGETRGQQWEVQLTAK